MAPASAPSSQKSGIPRISLLTALPRAIASFFRHRGLFLAAGLSFYFLVGMIPLILLFASVAGFLYSGETATDALIAQLSGQVPVYQREITQLVHRIVTARGGSGLAGAGALYLLSTQLFSALRIVMDVVFGVKRGRGFVHGLLWDVLMMLFLGALLVGNITVHAAFLWVKLSVFTAVIVPPAWFRGVFFLLAVSFNVALLYAIYRSFPSRSVDHRAALRGALVAGVLWELAKALFRNYVLTVGTIDVVYGPIAFFVAVSVFAYWSGIVTILGAEVANALDPE